MDTTGGTTAGGHIAITGQGVVGEGRVPTLYAHAIDRAGGVAKVFSPFDHLKEDEHVPPGLEVRLGVDPDDLSPLDGAVGLLLPGGGDIDPINYGQPRHPLTRRISREGSASGGTGSAGVTESTCQPGPCRLIRTSYVVPPRFS
ncbi:MAG: hypothetical protein ACLGHL_07015, partial [Actinomycetota bacterium]